MTRHPSRTAIATLTAVLLAGLPACDVRAQQQAPPPIPFAVPGSADLFQRWTRSPDVVRTDSAVYRSAPHASRIERSAVSAGPNGVINVRVPVEFSGTTLELRGWLRTEAVLGWAGLWLRQDGPSGALALDNMQQRAVTGTTEWTEYVIRMPLHRQTRTLALGAHLVGQGTVWLDDLELLVDGAPASEAPPAATRVEDLRDTYDDGSGIEAFAPTDVQADNLALLGRVWGFVKYHHPEVTGGGVHWDYALFDVLPEVLAAPDRAAAHAVMDAWLAELEPLDPCDPCAPPPADVHLPAEVDWIRDEALLGAALSARLVDIHRNRSAAGQHYVALNTGVGNPDFSAEAAYAAPRLPDAGYRLLALFRLWNIVEYWFPYRDVIGARWEDVLREYVPLLAEAGDATAYRLAMMQVIARIHDTHANLWSDLDVRPPAGRAQVPLALRFVEGQAVVTGFAEGTERPAGIERGDVITAVDGAPVDSLVEAWRPYYAASNEPTRLRDVARSLTRGAEGPVTLGMRRGDSTFTVSAERATLDPAALAEAFRHDLPGPTFQRLTPEVAYLKLSSVEAAKAADYIRQAEGAEVLVMDIRNYPSEFMVFALGRHLVGRPTAFARFTRGDLANPGAFVWGPTVTLQPAEPHFDGRVVILVDETSQSQAEYTTMAFRTATDALVAGSTTAGADGNVSPILLPGGLRAMISGIGVFYPDGTPTQRVGIVPDLEVRPTVEGIRAGRDEVLEAAVSAALGRTFRLPSEGR